MQSIKLDETDYTSNLVTALNEYVKQRGIKLPAPSVPHAKRQSYKNLDKSRCFDLIQKLSESSLLVLEVKVTHDSIKLHSFDPQQQIVDSALRDTGIPIEYCYNTAEDYAEVNNAEYTLQETLSSSPLLVADSKGIINKNDPHVDLKKLVDNLLSTGTANAGMIGALFSTGLLTRMRDLDIKVLFFSLHAGNLTIYTKEEMQDIYDAYATNVTLGQGLNLNKATYKELTLAFQTSADELKKILTNWKSEKKQKEQKEQKEQKHVKSKFTP
jgi:hypothetical protein